MLKRQLSKLEGAPELVAQHRFRWILAGLGLLALGVPIAAVMSKLLPPGPWPNYFFALPALPVVIPAWFCFKKAGWARLEAQSPGTGMSAWRLGCLLLVLAFTLMSIGGIVADHLHLLP
jgi:hypothetical protein